MHFVRFPLFKFFFCYPHTHLYIENILKGLFCGIVREENNCCDDDDGGCDEI